jgi:signal transduction histidine kinase
MTPLALIIQGTLFLTIIIDSALFFFILLKRKSDPVSTLVLLHIFGVLGWSVTVFYTLREEDVFAAKLTFTFALMFGLAKYWFAVIFPENTFPKTWRSYWTIPLGCFTFFVTLFDNTIFTKIHSVQGVYIEVDNGPYGLFYLCVISYLLIAPLFILYKKYKHATHRVIKSQLKYLTLGFTLSFTSVLISNELLPVLFHVYDLNAVGPAFSLILVAFMIYVIRHHQFLNIRNVIQRSVIYAALLGLTIAVYLSFVSIFGYVFQKTAHVTILLSAGMTMIIGILGTPIIERYFRRLTDPLFFKDTYDYAAAMRILTQILNHNITTTIIVNESVQALKNILKTERVTFLFLEKTQKEDTSYARMLEEVGTTLRHVVSTAELSYPKYQGEDRSEHLHAKHLRELGDAYHAELIVPIMIEERLLGALFVGTKRSGDEYTLADISLLENFSSQVAIAFEKALLYEQVASYSTSLEQKVEERTREIVLLREQERQMMADISHGLQTPLTIIKSELGKLKGQLPETGRLSAFERSIDMISKFIYDLLTLARLDKTENIAHMEPVDFSELVSDLAEYTTISAEAEGIHTSEKITPGIFVNGEKDRLTEAIVNILGNAMKYMGSGSKKEMTVTLSKDVNHVILAIADTGIGIPESDLPHLFERFYRVSNKGDACPKGTGLGLAITKRIVERHGGTVRAESTLGKGTTFTIVLPLAEAA